MTKLEMREALAAAEEAAKAAGALMRRNFHSRKRVNSATQRDIKLEWDVRCQKLIERRLRRALPAAAILGEEGTSGNVESPLRWVVDPIDGTVNFAYEIPHACVSIALQVRRTVDGEFETSVGVVYDPFVDELWTAIRGGPARLNGRVIRVSQRERLAETIVSVGFSKHRHTLDRMLPFLNRVIHRVRKIRIMGAAALALVYVASGRLDAYVELGLRLWDVAAGGLILECAGGEFWHRPAPGVHTCQILASNGRLRKRLQRLASPADGTVRQ